MEQPTKHIVVIGGGITGLSAAYYVQQLVKKEKLPYRITLLESSDTFGGKIKTLYRDDFIIEKGPDSFLSRKLPMITLAKELGIEDQLIGMNPSTKKSYILHKGRFHPIPEGSMFGIPTKVAPFVKSGLISPIGKLRCGLDFIKPRNNSMEDESIGHFLRRRLGEEVAEQIAEPLLAGIYAGDIDQLSIQATFPQFLQLEKKYRSLILGLANSKKNTQASQELPEYAKKSVFLTYKKGLMTLVDALVSQLDGVQLKTSCTVSSIHKTDNGTRLELDDGSSMDADAVITTIPANHVTHLYGDVPSIDQLNQIKYSSVGNIALAFKAKHIHQSFDGTGFLVPRKEGRFITACTWTSTKWTHVASEDNVLMRCYVGRLGDERFMHMNDAEIKAKVLQELEELIGVKAKPMFVETTRLYHSMPQYPVGHTQLIAEVRENVREHFTGHFLTGASFKGIGLPDCIQQGKDTANDVMHFLKEMK
ncbi:protoporphyrinogen oxidase [Longirhabdus pacifica]|uniref:protoporphyrinogen oxidase n=1 Tax=Longirhabdus pacifica TaxID=2305227 RepID=UPI0010087DAF|nr:protoporphyrinogen oxidase [Longirhabdus pacifica]